MAAASWIRIRLRCQICGRPRAVYRKFGICRICFRNLASDGLIPGVRRRLVTTERARTQTMMTDPIADMLTRIRNANRDRAAGRRDAGHQAQGATSPRC